MKINCRKAWKGKIDIRSTYVENAIRDNTSITVTCDQLKGESIYSPRELKNPLYIQGPYKSKLKENEEYFLHVFAWKN